MYALEGIHNCKKMKIKKDVRRCSCIKTGVYQKLLFVQSNCQSSLLSTQSGMLCAIKNVCHIIILLKNNWMLLTIFPFFNQVHPDKRSNPCPPVNNWNNSSPAIGHVVVLYGWGLGAEVWPLSWHVCGQRTVEWMQGDYHKYIGLWFLTMQILKV